MKTSRKRSVGYLLNLFVLLAPLLFWVNAFAQVESKSTAGVKEPFTLHSLQKNNIRFESHGSFIQNIGQYKDQLTGFSQMGRIVFAYEGLNMPVLITTRGLIHLQRKTKKISSGEWIDLRKKGWKDKDILQANSTTRTIGMEWVNANPNPVIVTEQEDGGYLSYLFLKEKARTFRKIIVKELYPGIDLVYSIDATRKAGFEYSLLVQPGADVSKVKIRYSGDVKVSRLSSNGNLVVSSDIEDINVSAPSSFYADDHKDLTSSFRLNNNTLHFAIPAGYNRNKKLVIDPFVSGTGTLTGTDAGKAKDIDFDYAGNIYVAGGGDGSVQRLSKFNASGVLQWTFNGSLNSPCWEFGSAHGGWAVDRISGKIYLGQGLNNDGFRIIRLDENGIYDNYTMDAGSDFTQNCKMLWICNSGNSTIYIAGGGGSGTGNTSNVELFRFSPSAHSLTPINITGINTGNTDISDLVADQATGQLYTAFSTSILDPTEDNKLFKHTPPFSHHDISWSINTGCFALHEQANRPYLSGLDNSSNTIAVNAQYLFYWDGKNLKAFNKSDGMQTCTPVVVASNQLLMQGGIIADECNNVYVGSVNGTIKTYRFNGSSFDDNAIADIAIPGYTSGSIYDLIYYPEQNLLYASGDGFVASFDLAANCTIGTTYTLHITPDCSSTSVTATVSPVPPPGSFVTYNLYDGSALIASNNSGQFNNLIAEKNYRATVTINQSCSGNSATNDFTAHSPALLKINAPAGVCPGNTFDLTAPSVTQGSSLGMVFSYWTDAAATIAVTNPTSVRAGIYYIKATAVNGCVFISSVEIKTSTEPKADAGADAVVCSGSNYQLTGNGGISYSWSPATYLSSAAIANPVISNPGITGSITYRLKVKDANGCESRVSDEVKITFAAPATVFIDSDSAVSINQPLHLIATDPAHNNFVDYRWTPAYGLNNPFIRDPVARLDKEMTYTVLATTKYNCKASASITVKVYRGPEIYVPNSFTPNGDGLNDVLKPIPVGLAEFHYLKVFNRFGQLLYTVTDPSKGWNGKVNGEPGFGTYIWIAEGIDYKGNLIMRKGATTIIR